MAALQLEAETRLFSLQQAKCLGQEKWLRFMQLTTCKERLFLLGIYFVVPCWLYENFQLPFLLCLSNPRVLMIIINLGCFLSEEAFVFGAV